MITHVIVKLDAPIEEKYWQDDDIFSNEYYGLGKPLIRCKDCTKFVAEEDQAYCLDMYGQCDENGFCAWAERKEE